MSDKEYDSASSLDYEQEKSDDEKSDDEHFNQKEAIKTIINQDELDQKSDDEYFERKDNEDEEESEEDDIKKYCPIEKNTIINDRYKIVKKLGWGRFSVVWMAVDKNLLPEDQSIENIDISTVDRKFCVALKIYKSSSEYDEYYQNENSVYNLLKGKKHPNVVNMIESFYTQSEYGKHGCIVFELCGQHLLKLLNRTDDGGLPIPIVKKIVKQTLEGIKFLHDNGIIHTDIKPENILLTLSMKQIDTVDDLNIKITDLGSSTPADNLYSLSIGTTPYIPPEVVLRSKYDKSVDIWGIGCLLFELITGECLFDPESFFDENCEIDEDDSNDDNSDDNNSDDNKKEENKSEEDNESEEEDEEESDQEYDTNSSDCDANDWELNHLHLSLFTKILGPIPQSVAKKGEYYEDFFNSRGRLRRIPNYIDEKTIAKLLEDDFKVDKELSVTLQELLQKMFIYHPSKRATAEQCLEFKWFEGDYQAEYQKMLDEFEKEKKSK